MSSSGSFWSTVFIFDDDGRGGRRIGRVVDRPAVRLDFVSDRYHAPHLMGLERCELWPHVRGDNNVRCASIHGLVCTQPIIVSRKKISLALEMELLSGCR